MRTQNLSNHLALRAGGRTPASGCLAAGRPDHASRAAAWEPFQPRRFNAAASESVEPATGSLPRRRPGDALVPCRRPLGCQRVGASTLRILEISGIRPGRTTGASGRHELRDVDTRSASDGERGRESADRSSASALSPGFEGRHRACPTTALPRSAYNRSSSTAGAVGKSAARRASPGGAKEHGPRREPWDPVATHGTSPGGAKEHGPRREPWEPVATHRNSPGGPKEGRRERTAPLSFAPPGLRFPPSAPHGLRRGLRSFAATRLAHRRGRGAARLGMLVRPVSALDAK